MNQSILSRVKLYSLGVANYDSEEDSMEEMIARMIMEQAMNRKTLLSSIELKDGRSFRNVSIEAVDRRGNVFGYEDETEIHFETSKVITAC